MPSSHSGTVATSSAASPDGTVFSPTPTTPLATSSKMPTIAQPSHSARVGQARPAVPAARAPARRLRRASGNMARLATRFRAAAISSGGIVSTPTLMAR